MPKQYKGPDYEAEFISAIRANLKLVLDLLDSKDAGLQKRIGTFASRFDFAVEEVEKHIRKDKMFRAVFAKDPGKQKIHENIAAAYIKTLPNVKNFKQLGHDALVVFRGLVDERKNVRASGATSTAKTIDFRWEGKNGKKVYASHKYTKQSGGAQDNQYRDLQEFIREARESNLKDVYFLAVADGPYYKTKDVGSHSTKMEHLKNLANGRNTFALSTDELVSWLNKYCS